MGAEAVYSNLMFGIRKVDFDLTLEHYYKEATEIFKKDIEK